MSTENFPCHPEHDVFVTEADARASIVESLSETVDTLDLDFDGEDLAEHGHTWDDVVAAAWDLDAIYAEAIEELECTCLDEHEPDAIRGDEHGTFYATLPGAFWEIADRHSQDDPTIEEL